jgi:hypothetical protein
MTFETYLNESSLGRIYQHIKKESTNSWGMISPYRNENSPKENSANYQELKKLVRDMGYGFIEILGYGQEEDEFGGINQSEERTLFVPNITKKQISRLADKYNQWGYVYSGPEIENNKIALISNDKIVDMFSKFVPNKAAEFFSKIKGKSFVFEEVLPGSNIERQISYLSEMKKFPKANAYWISPKGEVSVVGTKHIDDIVSNPKKFNLTKEEIDAVYEKHNEPKYVEGDARAEIMNELIRYGWIRVRLEPRSRTYTLEFWREKNRTLDNIYDFCLILREEEYVGIHAGIRLLNASKKQANTYDISDILSFKIFETIKHKKILL